MRYEIIYMLAYSLLGGGFLIPIIVLSTNLVIQIVAISLSVRKYTAANTSIKAIRFITNYLLPPPKKDVLAYLGIPLSTGEVPGPAKEVARKAEVDVSNAKYDCTRMLMFYYSLLMSSVGKLTMKRFDRGFVF